MRDSWERKPGDRIIHLHRLERHRLRRVLGVPGLWATGYGDVGSSIYYALGIVALVALGATPVVLGIAGIIFVFNALTYAEGVSMLPESGGSSSFARHGFNELIGFIAGWSLVFSYVVTIAISSFTIPSYLGYFWQPLKESQVLAVLVSIGIVAFLTALNVLGVRESTFLSLSMAIIDVVTQVFLVFLGMVFLFDPHLLAENVTLYWPEPHNFVFGIAVASIAFTGVESVSQLVEETRRPQVRAPRAYVAMMVTVLVLFAGISLVAFSVMTPQQLATDWATDPVAGIAATMPDRLALSAPADPALNILFNWFVSGLRHLLPLLVAVLAATILLIATNAGVLGISRLSFSLGEHQELPQVFSRIHRRFRTPYIAILVFSAIAVLLQIPGLFLPNLFTLLGGLYAFGSLLTFALAHASILALRVRQPDHARPFKLSWNVLIKGRQLPVTAILGLIATTGIWVVLIVFQPYSRWLGIAWMIVGVALYYWFRKRAHLPILHAARKLRGGPK
ncbi:MAG: APC family permease [Chloroflexi bacterium]|nr:APC family permease [Chloroflexota bacterium]